MIEKECEQALELLRFPLNPFNVVVQLLQGFTFGDRVLLLDSLENKKHFLGEAHHVVRGSVGLRITAGYFFRSRCLESVLVLKVRLRELTKDIDA